MFKALVLTQTLFGLSLAANDWSKACLDGTCSYEGGDGVNSAWATLDLQGSPQTLSDITVAAGWTISGCKSTWASGVANIQLKCEGTAQQTANCNHLFEGGAAAGKVVRLPQNCGVGAFARVVSATETADSVFDVALDYDFSQVAGSSAQPLSFSISASNVKDGVTDSARLRVRRNMPQRRYPIALTPRFDFDQTKNLDPITLNKNFNLFNQSFDCPAAAGGVGVSASVKVSADVGLDIRPAFGVKISGDVFPFPKVTSFGLTATATGSASAVFDITASGTGSFTTGDIQLFQVGLPGLNFPGILNIGPQFVINTKLDAALELQANVRAGATYQLPEVSLVFPPSGGKSAANIKPVPEALDLSLQPSITADGSVTASLIPSLEFGIEVLKGLAEASVFLNIEGTAKLGVNAKASADIAPGEDIETSVGGCATLDAGVAVVAGATGTIPGIFDETASFDIFRKDVNLFERCFGDQAKRSLKRSYRIPPSARPSPSKMAKRALSCPSAGAGGILQSVLNL